MAIQLVSANKTSLASAATSLTLTASGVQTGDFLLATVANCHGDLSGGLPTPPGNQPVPPNASWTLIGSEITDYESPRTVAAFWKRAGSGDVGAPGYTFTFGGQSSQHNGTIIAFSGVAGIDATASDEIPGPDPWDLPSVTTSVAGDLVIAIVGVWGTANLNSSLTFSEGTEVGESLNSRVTISAAIQTLDAVGLADPGTATVTSSLYEPSAATFTISLRAGSPPVAQGGYWGLRL